MAELTKRQEEIINGLISEFKALNNVKDTKDSNLLDIDELKAEKEKGLKKRKEITLHNQLIIEKEKEIIDMYISKLEKELEGSNIEILKPNLHYKETRITFVKNRIHFYIYIEPVGIHEHTLGNVSDFKITGFVYGLKDNSMLPFSIKSYNLENILKSDIFKEKFRLFYLKH